MDHSSEVMMFACLLAAVAFTLWLLFRRYQVSMEVRMQRIESFNKLIEKFGSAKEFTEYAQTDEGKKLLADPVLPPPNPLAKVLRFLQAGIIFLMIGFADWINASRLGTEADPNYVHQKLNADYWGTLAVFLGLGLMVTAGVSYMIVKRWHLTNGSLQK